LAQLTHVTPTPKLHASADAHCWGWRAPSLQDAVGEYESRSTLIQK
jgi:hypothetical protein